MTTHKLLVMVGLAVALSAGCTSVKSGGVFKWPWEKKTEESQYEIPSRMVVTWSYNILSVPGKSPAPGFGARIYFYNNRSQAIPVDGSVLVYAYDDTQVVEPSSPPTAKFAFSAKQFTQHFKETDMGASYSIWVPIPWHEANGPPRSVSLIPVFTDARGGQLVGNQSLNLLPGRTKNAGSKFPTRFIRQPDGTLVPEEGGAPTKIEPQLVQAARGRMKTPTVRTTSIPLSQGLIRQSQNNAPGSTLLPQQARFLERQLTLSTRALQNNVAANNVRLAQTQGATLGMPVAQGIPAVGGQSSVQPASATQATAAVPPRTGRQKSSSVDSKPERFRVSGTRVSRPIVRRNRQQRASH